MIWVIHVLPAVLFFCVIGVGGWWVIMRADREAGENLERWRNK